MKRLRSTLKHKDNFVELVKAFVCLTKNITRVLISKKLKKDRYNYILTLFVLGLCFAEITQWRLSGLKEQSMLCRLRPLSVRIPTTVSSPTEELVIRRVCILAMSVVNYVIYIGYCCSWHQSWRYHNNKLHSALLHNLYSVTLCSRNKSRRHGDAYHAADMWPSHDKGPPSDGMM